MADSVSRVRRREFSRFRWAALTLLTGYALTGCTEWPAPFTAIAPSHADLSAMREMGAPLSLESLDPDRISRAIFHATNETRVSLGLKPFQSLSQLNEAADLQASSNALNQKLSHHNFVSAWATPYDRVRILGLMPSAISENAALLPLYNVDPINGYIQRTTPEHGTVVLDATTGEVVQPHTYASFARAIVKAWMNSPGHRSNIVNPHFQYLGCSARPTKSLAGFDLITGIQVFYTPAGR